MSLRQRSRRHRHTGKCPRRPNPCRSDPEHNRCRCHSRVHIHRWCRSRRFRNHWTPNRLKRMSHCDTTGLQGSRCCQSRYRGPCRSYRHIATQIHNRNRRSNARLLPSCRRLEAAGPRQKARKNTKKGGLCEQTRGVSQSKSLTARESTTRVKRYQ